MTNDIFRKIYNLEAKNIKPKYLVLDEQSYFKLVNDEYNLFTMAEDRQYGGILFAGLNVAIVYDIKHSICDVVGY